MTNFVLLEIFWLTFQGLFQQEKRVVWNSLGIMDLVIGLVNSILNLPTRQEVFWGIQITEVLYSILLIKNFFGEYMLAAAYSNGNP